MSLAALAVVALLPRAAPTVAVLPGRVPEGSSLSAVFVDDALRAGVDDEHARLVPVGVVDGVITRARADGLRCDPGVVDCAARLGAFGGFDFVVVAVVEDGAAPVGVTPLRVTLVDCATGRAVRVVRGPLAAAPDDARRGLQALAHAAVAGDDAVSGALRVDGEGVVVVDGVVRGDAPLTLALPAGSHDVRVGGGAARAIAVPVAAEVAVAGAPASEDPWPALGVAAAIAGAAIAVGGVAGAVAIAPDPAARRATSAADYNDAVVAGRALLVVAGAGAALGGAGLAVWATRGAP